MKKLLSILLSVALMVTLISGGITVTAAERDNALGASACCEGHTLGTFSGVPACVNENGDLHVCENNFSDDTFRNKILSDAGTDGYFTAEEANSVTSTGAVLKSVGTNPNNPNEYEVLEEPIETLKGIEFFTELTSIRAMMVGLQEVNISNNSKLAYLECTGNKLSKLDLYNNSELRTLHCDGNMLPELDLSGNTKLPEEIMYPGDPESPLGVELSPQYIPAEAQETDDGFTIDLSTFVSSENLGRVTELSAGTYDSETGIVTFDIMPTEFTYKFDVGNDYTPMEVNVTITNAGYGDADGDGEITSDDAAYLLYNTLYPEEYPLRQACDFNGDGKVNSDDAVYLLYHTLYPEEYPLEK